MRPVQSSTERLGRLLIVAALTILGLLTLVDRGATRIYATPWNALFWFVQLVPIVVLVLRTTLPMAAPFRLPPPRWALALAVLTLALELSAAFSPFRGVSVLAAGEPLTAIATFFLTFDWLARDRQANGYKLLRAAGCFSTLLVLCSLVLWIFQDLRSGAGAADSLAALLRIQNAHPLGHTSYTAGLALLALPWPAILAWRAQGRTRFFWALIAMLATGMLLSSGSRGGVIGLAAFLFAALWLARWGWRRTLLTSFIALLIVSAGAYAHPRTRTLLFARQSGETAPNLSNVQRSAMAKAGWLMGRERPLFGWGPGTTPRAYPKFRAQLDGGVETALQLHSTPVQLWADLGAIGVGCVAVIAGFAVAAAVRTRRATETEPSHGAFSAAILTLAGYGAFSLTDYQLDVPIFAFGLAVCGACVAAWTRGEVTPPTTTVSSRRVRYGIGAFAVSPLLLIATLGEADPAPELNVRALQLAADSSHPDEAIALLRDSLRLNPDQEIAHFNLGWLLVIRDPAEAEQHFLTAAKLVPDKGGVYFGLALARINRGSPANDETATRALALECLNDPIFLVSPWWKNPALAPLRAPAIEKMQAMAKAISAGAESRPKPYVQQEAAYIAALSAWLDGHRSSIETLPFANTTERRAWFSREGALPDFAGAKVRKYRRERSGYPVLMRDLDLPAPIDVFDVQENDLAAGDLRFLFPPKGWAPSPEVAKLLQ